MVGKYLRLKHRSLIMRCTIYKIIAQNNDMIAVTIIGKTYFNYTILQKSDNIHKITMANWMNDIVAAEDIWII